MVKRQEKITFGEMRASGVNSVRICCADHKCGHSVVVSAEQWPDNARLSDLEARFVCIACGKRGSDITPNFPGG